MTSSRLITSAVLALTLFGAAACSGSDDSGATTPATAPATDAPIATETQPDTDAADATDAAEVSIAQSRFDPLEISVGVGGTVTFTNTDPFAHTVTAKDDSPQQFDSGNFGQDETFQVEFAEAGTFDYFCQIHPTMRASVIVG
ncbi:MAG: amidase [Ilumatobacter sp.]|nr:amidase [Ilumatobacter sp.]